MGQFIIRIKGILERSETRITATTSREMEGRLKETSERIRDKYLKVIYRKS